MAKPFVLVATVLAVSLTTVGLAAGQQLDSKACAPGERATIGSVPAPAGTTPSPQVTAPGEALGDKLARTDGVICPPAVGDTPVISPLQGSAMPVIPPPGSPGGDQSVQPK